MRWRRLWLIVTVLALSAAPGSAGIIFNRKPKPNPAERVPQLVYQLKTDKDDDKRAQAAEELRNFDAAAYPEIVNALVEAALGDPKPKVRSEAVQSLGKIRPIARPGDRRDLPGLSIQPAAPGHAEAAILDGQPAGLPKQLAAVGHPHDQLPTVPAAHAGRR